MNPADPHEILALAKARVGEVVPGADLTAFAVAFSIVRAAERVTLELETAHQPMGWTWPGFRVMWWLWLLGPLEPRQIAEVSSSSRASVSSALNTLERNGFVERRRGVDRPAAGERRADREGLRAHGRGVRRRERARAQARRSAERRGAHDAHGTARPTP